MEPIHQIFNFFIDPYLNLSYFDIGLEITAVFFGITSVLFAKRENILVYPTGLISTCIYVFICFQYTLYGDLLINIYYSLMSIYGWYMWSKITDNRHLPISRCTSEDWKKVGAIFASTSLFIIIIYLYTGRFHETTDYFDTLTSGIFFAGMWLMANKKIEHWSFWIIGNFISIPLYFVKGLGFSGIQFTIFLFLAYQGHKTWTKTLNKTRATA